MYPYLHTLKALFVQGKQALVVFTALKVIPMVAKADNH
jgi:hypothetical protein